jgi:hypothetical protein
VRCIAVAQHPALNWLSVKVCVLPVSRRVDWDSNLVADVGQVCGPEDRLVLKTIVSLADKAE